MEFYPARPVDPKRSPIRIIGGAKFEAEVMRILRYLHYGAGSRASSLIIQGLIRNGDPRKAITIRNANHGLDNAFTRNVDTDVSWDQPRSTAVDLLKDPGRGIASNIDYFPWEWWNFGSGPPGYSRDEILLHELVHAFTSQRGISSVRKLTSNKYPTRVRRFTIVDDFYAVMITNVYASECGRKPRRDHVGGQELDQTALGLTLDPAFSGFFTALKGHAPELVQGLAAIDTEFNPWNPRTRVSDLLDAQLYPSP